MPRAKKDEAFDRFVAYIEMKGRVIQRLNGKTTKEVYQMYTTYFDGTLSQRAFTARLHKIYGQWLDCPAIDHGRRWVRK